MTDHEDTLDLDALRAEVARLSEKAEWWERTCEYWNDQTKARERTIRLLEVDRDSARAQRDAAEAKVAAGLAECEALFRASKATPAYSKRDRSDLAVVTEIIGSIRTALAPDSADDEGAS